MTWFVLLLAWTGWLVVGYLSNYIVLVDPIAYNAIWARR